MKKIKIDFKNFYLFSVPVDFDIAWLKILFSNHLVVRLEYGGKEGIGEGVLYKTSSLKALDLLVKEFEEFFQQEEFTSFTKAREKLLEAFSLNPGLVCAFDLALWDLEGKIKKKPVYQLLARKKLTRNKVVAAEQIFIPPNKIYLIRQVKKILDHKTRLIKLKTGRNLKDDFDNIQLIKGITGDEVEIQVDLNQGLNFNQAVLFGKKLKTLGVTAWEEPIRFKDFSQLKKLKRRVKLPLILDESIQSIDDLKQAVKKRTFEILNVKINRLGGLTNSLRLIKLCRKHRVEIQIGCNEELGIGTSAQIHLANSLRNLRAMEALGSQRLKLDLIKENQEIRGGFLKAAVNRPGLGVNLNLHRLRRTGRRFKFPIITKTEAEAPFIFYRNYFYNRLRSKFINGLLFLHKSINHLWLKN